MGAFVLILGAVLIAGILWLATGGDFQKKFDLYLAIENESVAGLNLNAPVKYNGVDVGKVRDIQLDPANPERVRLIFAIERDAPIKEDTVAVLKIQGLTGIAYVELSGGAKNAAPLRAKANEQYPEIRTIPSLGTRLENVLTTVLAKLDHTSSNIDAWLGDENRATFTNTLKDIATVAHTIAARKDSLDASIVSASRTLDHTEHATAQLEPMLKQTFNQTNAMIGQIDRSAAAIEKTSNEAAIASKSAGKAFDSVDTNVQRYTNETLPEVQRLLAELNDLAASLRRLSNQTERDPASLLRGRSTVPNGPGESQKATKP